jgi:hypothetical protein
MSDAFSICSGLSSHTFSRRYVYIQVVNIPKGILGEYFWYYSYMRVRNAAVGSATASMVGRSPCSVLCILGMCICNT